MTTVRDAIEDAYRLAGVVAEDEAMTADQAATGERALQRMLSSWQARGYNLFQYTRASVAATTSATYTLAFMPHRILNIRFKRDGIETPMEEITRNEYDSLPVKTSRGLPTTWYLDRQRDSATVYVWPLLAAASGETLEISYERPTAEIVTLNDDLDLPDEWEEAAIYNLAVRLGHKNIPVPLDVVRTAREMLELALADDREGSVYFHDC